MSELDGTTYLYAGLHADLSVILGARRRRVLHRPIEAELGLALDRFLGGEWSAARLGQPAGDVTAMQVLGELRNEMMAALRVGPGLAPAHLEIAERASVLVGERLVGMRAAGEPDARTDAASTFATTIILNAQVAATTHAIAATEGVDPRRLAPAVFAAVSARRGVRAKLSPGEALRQYQLTSGEPDAMDDRVAVQIEATLRSVERRLGQVLGTYEGAGRDLARRVAPGTSPSADEGALQALVGFEASARGGGDAARVDGATELYRTVTGVARIRRGLPGDLSSRYMMATEGAAGLQRLARLVATERGAHRRVEEEWREVDKEMRYARAKNTRQGAAISLPDEVPAAMARAMYLQEAAYRGGVPLGTLLAELYDPASTTYGPSEREFLQGVACYAARRYASDLAARTDPIVDRVAGNDVGRAESVRVALQKIETELRADPHQEDEALLAIGSAGLARAVAEGALRSDYAKNVESIVDQMVMRVRAGEEVRFVTALLAVEGRVPADIVESYYALPHTRRYAASPKASLATVVARNGEQLLALERDTRDRWNQYRAQAPHDQDVVTIGLDGLAAAPVDPLEPVGPGARGRRRERPASERRVVDAAHAVMPKVPR